MSARLTQAGDAIAHPRRIPRLFTTHPLAIGKTVELEARNHHYLYHVLRLRPDARLIVFNGQGGEYQASLRVLRGKPALLIEAYLNVERESPLAIYLLQGIAKPAHMDYALQKAVELGVSHIQPVLCQRTAGGAALSRKVAHWQGIVISACEQSGRTRLPDVASPLPLEAAIQGIKADLRLVLWPFAEHALRNFHTQPASVALLIGPEGGLTEAEVRTACQQDFIAVHLGRRILRTETATSMGIGAVQLLWGDLDSSNA